MALAWTKTDSPAWQDADGPTVTFSSVAIGTAAADRIVVIKIATHANPVDSVTIGGSAATLAIANTGVHAASIWYRAVPTGTTADVVLTNAIWFAGVIGITAGSLTGADDAPSDTDANNYNYDPDPENVTVTVPTGGIALVIGTSDVVATPSWTNGTQDYNTEYGTAGELVTGYNTSAGDQTVGISGWNYSGFCSVAVAWEPASGAGSTPGSIWPTITL